MSHPQADASLRRPTLHPTIAANPVRLHDNLAPAILVERAIERGEGQLAANGSLVVQTGQFTGRSPKDKYIVRDAITESAIHWGPVNQPLDSGVFERILRRVDQYLGSTEVFVKDCFGGADPKFQLPVRVTTERAWHSLFAHQLFLRPSAQELASFVPQFHLIFLPGFQADPEVDGVRSTTLIAIDFTRKVILIAGTEYAGEMKKSVFTILNFLLPERAVFPMHCSANMGQDGRVALFFGLSGTGKTTLSADPQRQLIGDDEHGWSEDGVFNFEGGCYAKTIKLSKEKEPQIYDAIRFGAVLENVVLDPTSRAADYDSELLTENTRAAYPLDFISNARIPSIGGVPNHIVFLTADAFGVLPPISRLTTEQAMFHFLSGYTAKLAGTERGLSKEPTAVFSTCFGEPFLPRHPKEYAAMLGEKLQSSRAKCWLVNTGWIGGGYGVGERMRLEYTRSMVNAAIHGMLDFVETEIHPVFGVEMPKSVPGVPAVLLDPRSTWPDKAAYDLAALDLLRRFQDNYRRFES